VCLRRPTLQALGVLLLCFLLILPGISSEHVLLSGYLASTVQSCPAASAVVPCSLPAALTGLTDQRTNKLASKRGKGHATY
jgi:hypothetical protein